MPERCDICGVSALDGQVFVLERIPFLRAKLYCPACHRRLLLRVYSTAMILLVGFGCWGIVAAWHEHTGLLDSVLVWLPVLYVFQWLLILPHELGHAFVARHFGLAQIRILIGGGRPIFACNFLGFPMLVNRIPFGGLTLFKHERKPNRWRHFLVVVAGPLVNIAAAGAVWPFLPAGPLLNFSWTLPKLFLGANLLVLFENLLPHSVFTPFGMVGSDGLQLWLCLFRWNKPLPPVRAAPLLAKVRMHQFAKWASFTLLAMATLLFSLFAAFPWIPSVGEITLKSRILITAIMLPLTLLAGLAAIWTAKSTINRFSTGMPGGEERMRENPYTPEQLQSLHEAFHYAAQKDFARAEAIVDQLTTSTSISSAGYTQVLLLKFHCMLASNAIDRAEKYCMDLVNVAANSDQKIALLFCLVSCILRDQSSPYLEHAERLARLAVEIAPGSLALKGTLGGVLAERGKFAEADPLLVACLNRSPDLHTQGASAYYLGVVKAANGKLKEAKSLFKRSIVLHPEPWLLAKAEAMLQAMDKKS
jgi:hypothetical protein